MPTVPVKAAGWRIEPPVSVAVAPAQMWAATAAADPPDEPPGTRSTLDPLARHGFFYRPIIRRLVGGAHGELIHVQFAQHDSAIGPQIGGNRRFISRFELVKYMAAGLGVDALGGKQILDPQRDAFQCAGFAPGDTAIAGSCHLTGLVGCFDDVGVQGARGFDRADISISQFGGLELPLLQSIAGLGNRKCQKVGHLFSGNLVRLA